MNTGEMSLAQRQALKYSIGHEWQRCRLNPCGYTFVPSSRGQFAVEVQSYRVSEFGGNCASTGVLATLHFDAAGRAL